MFHFPFCSDSLCLSFCWPIYNNNNNKMPWYVSYVNLVSLFYYLAYGRVFFIFISLVCFVLSLAAAFFLSPLAAIPLSLIIFLLAMVMLHVIHFIYANGLFQMHAALRPRCLFASTIATAATMLSSPPPWGMHLLWQEERQLHRVHAFRQTFNTLLTLSQCVRCMCVSLFVHVFFCCSCSPQSMSLGATIDIFTDYNIIAKQYIEALWTQMIGIKNKHIQQYQHTKKMAENRWRWK